jgi:hypothetical protein
MEATRLTRRVYDPGHLKHACSPGKSKRPLLMPGPLDIHQPTCYTFLKASCLCFTFIIHLVLSPLKHNTVPVLLTTDLSRKQKGMSQKSQPTNRQKFMSQLSHCPKQKNQYPSFSPSPQTFQKISSLNCPKQPGRKLMSQSTNQ